MVQKDTKRTSHPLTITSSKPVTFQRAVLVVHGMQWTRYKLWERTGSMAAWLAGYKNKENVLGGNRVLVPGDNEPQISHKFFHVIPVNDGNYPDVYISNYPAGDLGPTGDNYLWPTIGSSISDYARELPEEIDYIKSKGPPFVSIVAHSMGGLVARRYIESRDFSNLPQSDPDYSENYYHGDVDKLIMLGTPNHGLFIALLAISAFASLLFSTFNWGLLFIMGVGALFWEPFLQRFILLEPIGDMGINGKFITTLNSGISEGDTGVDYYTIAGYVPVYRDFTDEIVYHLSWDGIVLSNEVRLKEARGNIDVFYADHSGLMQTKEIAEFIRSSLIYGSFSGQGEISVPYNPLFFKGHRFALEKLFGWPEVYVLIIRCPVNVTIKDQYGRIVDNQGHNEIPDAEVQVIDDEKNFCLPGDLSYTIELDAYSAGTFTMEAAYLGKGDRIVASVFKDVNIDANTKIISSLIEPGATNFNLAVDYDGNGIIDYYVTPDIQGTVGGNAPPSINLSAKLGPSSVILEWTPALPDTFSISGYNLYRKCLDDNREPTLISTVDASTTTYTDTTITGGKKYYYYVVAFDNASPPNYSEPSNPVIVDTSEFIYTITASAGPGGSISPSGAVTVNYGEDKSFTIKTDAGYFIYKILVDSTPIQFNNPMVYTYTFNNVTANHTIQAEFMKIPDTTPPTITKISGIDINVPKDIITNKNSYTFTVEAYDESGIARMVVKVNGVVQIDKNNLDPTIYLMEGTNTVEVTVYDTAGNYTTKSFKVISDTKPPVIDVTLPETVSSPEITVKGTVIDLVTGVQSVTVNGNPLVPTLEGSFETKLTLSIGTNTITIEATDKVGNKSTKSFTVSYIQPQAKQSYIVILKVGSPEITINGISKKIDAQGSKPIIKNGRTLLPIRTLIESLGGQVLWDAKEQKVTITLNGHSIILWIGKTTALVDGSKTTLDVAPIIINGRTYLPLRFISENLGASVNWDDKTQTITIYYWP